jgi:hypothetical protein
MFKKILIANRADYGTMLAKLGLRPMEAEEPLRACKPLEAAE